LSNDQLNLAIEEIKELEKAHFDLVIQLYKADHGNIFPVDFLALAVLNRSLSNTKGFCDLISENYMCAASIVRLQLDSLLRFFSIHLVNNPHDYVGRIMNGEQIDKIKDNKGQKMRDKYLVEQIQLRQNLPWLEKVYQQTSGFIHLSNKHTSTIFGDPES